VFRPRSRDQYESLLVSRPLVFSENLTKSHDSVLLLVVDTLRADATHFGGNPRKSSPSLDALAERSFRFRRAWSTAPWTHPSTASLLSGWSPWQHGLGQGPAGTTHLAADTPMVAMEFRRAGFATAAISGNSIVSPEEGFARGFDHFDTRAFENEQSGYSAQRITRAALTWIDDHQHQPFFAYLHYFDPHDRYQAPPPFTRKFVAKDLDASRMPASIREGAPNPIQDALVEGTPGFRVRPEEIRYLRDLYDGEVAYVDRWIGHLLDGLRERGLLERTWVIFTADHGEEFFEHGCVKHGQSLHQELVAVPLLLRPSDRSDLAVNGIDTPVSLMDLAPTLRDLCSLDRRDDTTARSWRPLLEGESPAAARPLLLANYSRVGGRWAGEQRGLVAWPWKWIRHRDPDAEYLFDLSSDPGEHDNLAATEPERCREMERQCAELYGEPKSPTESDSPVDPARLEKLKALGYVH
jgi:arylsulfatase